MPNSRHHLNCSINAKHWAQSPLFYQCQTLGTISTVLSIPNPWAWSQRLSMPNTGHNLNYSINAKHWAWSKLIYQYQTTGHDFREYYCQTQVTISNDLSMPNQWAWSQRLSMQNSRHHRNYSFNTKTLGTISEAIKQNSRHHLNYSINAKPLGMISETINTKLWAQSQLFY